MKFSGKVLIDANVIFKFSNNLELLFGQFDEVYIHEQVLDSEIFSEKIHREISRLKETLGNITIVVDNYDDFDSDSKKLFAECDKELKNSFNIEDNDDLGEYKTLLYSKFNNIPLFASQDTTVWVFLKRSTYFRGIECITIQDISYLLYLNAGSSKEKGFYKSIYNQVTRDEHKFLWFKKYMELRDNELPAYFEFESIRIENYKKLVDEYRSFYINDYNENEIKAELTKVAKQHPECCLSCLISRVDTKNIEFGKRICSSEFNFNDNECIKNIQLFDSKIDVKRGKL